MLILSLENKEIVWVVGNFSFRSQHLCQQQKSPVKNQHKMDTMHSEQFPINVGKRKDLFHCGSAHLVTQGFPSARPGSSLSSAASHPPRWPAGPGSCRSDLDTEESHSSVSANNTIILNCCLYKEFLSYKKKTAFYVNARLNHETKPIHTVVIFLTVLFECTVIEQMEKYESALEWPLLSFLHSKTDARCGLRSCVQPDVNQRDSLHTYSLRASERTNKLSG